MTICAINVCRNYKGRSKTTEQVTYHRIPNNPILRSRWIDIIRRSRGDDLWQPAKTTVICSDHFRAKDLYFINNQTRRRLTKEAMPCKALFLTSLETDDDDDENIDLPERKGNISDSETNVLDDAKTSGSNEEGSLDVTKDNDSSLCMDTSDKMLSNITVIAYDSTSGCTSIPGQETGNKIEDRRKKENESDTTEDFSDLDSVYDSPKKSKMRRDLRRRIKLQKVQTLKIQSLRRKNLRLNKKLATFKTIIGTLKDEINRLRHS